MADEDEDISRLRTAASADEGDLSDETQDFRFFDKLTAYDSKDLTLPKRGDKDFEPHATSLQLSNLEASRQAMHGVLSWQRIHTPKKHLLGLYDPGHNMASVERAKGENFQTIGQTKGITTWLLPEEALFLIEKGSLDCRWPVTKPTEDEDSTSKPQEGTPMSLQGAYAAFIGFEGGVGGKLTLEMYTVYASLKRTGYVVFRTGSWDDNRPGLQPSEHTALEHTSTNSSPQRSSFFVEIWRRLGRHDTEDLSKRLQCGPMVKLGLYRSYTDIYRLLEIIHTHDHKAPPMFTLEPDSLNPFRVTFDVYKPAGKFKKTARGEPDYRVAVINARETSVPTAAQLNDLLATTPYNAFKSDGNLYAKLRHGSRNVILAIVDNGIPSYIRIADVAFSEEKLYERVGRAPRGKGRSRGRGRGRGRGR
ncbi:uncharacterized protein BDR25DRAFT_221589 [Lindgomyces ingoldianus]|uniref:Uncharacterized protein n=1 Tax=Lindgomyces ingoldianus TaxID=673940 RepID=A0ACB6R0K1_9PLEO|nr:uncharacterized protein BDR25DRAFT_221589 [Lindgomyces ingoldianus]KAF2471981.1 hypothetical protein BDR25DRAFT_221589 [Lindgomyces ingoldianus]